MSTRLLITGGSGFIGRNLVARFSQKHMVFAPLHTELDLLNASDLEAYVRLNRVDSIIHSATAVGENYFEPTIQMFRSILRVAPFVSQIIYFGSGAEYGKNRDLIRIREEEWGNYIPEDPNGLSKFLNGVLSQSVPNILVLRPFGVYGLGEDYRKKFISNTIVKTLLGLPIRIKQNAFFDYLSIEDLVTITDYFLTSSIRTGMINITPDRSILLSDIAEIIVGMGSIRNDISLLTNGMNFEYTGDNAQLHALYPDVRFTSYEQGIKKLYTFYQSQKDKLDEVNIRNDSYLAQTISRV